MLLAILLDARLAMPWASCCRCCWRRSPAAHSRSVLSPSSARSWRAGGWRKERMAAYFVAGAEVSLVMLATYLAFFLASRSDDWSTLSIVSFELVVNGVLSALLAVGSFAVLGRMFGILTTMQLLELANPTQPLLRRLLMEAPGTYHHSIMVGNLGERAAEVIGADSLLVRVAAYYHDIGKLEAAVGLHREPGRHRRQRPRHARPGRVGTDHRRARHRRRQACRAVRAAAAHPRDDPAAPRHAHDQLLLPAGVGADDRRRRRRSVHLSGPAASDTRGRHPDARRQHRGRRARRARPFARGHRAAGRSASSASASTKASSTTAT